MPSALMEWPFVRTISLGSEAGASLGGGTGQHRAEKSVCGAVCAILNIEDVLAFPHCVGLPQLLSTLFF